MSNRSYVINSSKKWNSVLSNKSRGELYLSFKSHFIIDPYLLRLKPIHRMFITKLRLSSPISSKVDLTNSIHLKPCVPLMFIIYNKRAILDDNLLDNIRLFQKAKIQHFISITNGKRPRFTINQIVRLLML
jgi:hypothetical protein